jgi:hypothetical protein
LGRIGPFIQLLGLEGLFALVIVASSFLAAAVGVLASYAGFSLRKISNKILAVPEGPPSILRK